MNPLRGSVLPQARRIARFFVIAWALVCSASAYALDPIFQDALARTAFLKSHRGAQVVRAVIGDESTASRRLNHSDYDSFLLRLGWRQNLLLKEKLDHHLGIVLQEVWDLREASGGNPPKSPAEQVKEKKVLLEAAEREFDDPAIRDLVGIANLPDLEFVPESSRQIIHEVALESMSFGAPPGQMIHGLPEETSELRLNPRVGKLKNALAVRARVVRGALPLFLHDLWDMRQGTVPVPSGLSPEQARKYRYNYFLNIRRLVSLLGGYNDFVRDEYVYALFASTSRERLAALTLASADVLNRYKHGRLYTKEQVIEKMKKVAEEQDLRIAEVVWVALEHILSTIERLEFLCGRMVDGKLVPGEIAKTTRHVVHQQTELDELEKRSAELQSELTELKKSSSSDSGTLRMKKQEIASNRLRIENWTKNKQRSMENVLALYEEVVELRPLVEHFNYFREGLMSKGLKAQRVLNDKLDMDDAFIVPQENNDLWKTFERFGSGLIVIDPAENPGLELPDISELVISSLVKEQWRVLLGAKLRGESTEFANMMARLCQEATGSPIEEVSSMGNIAEYVNRADQKLSVIKKAIGIVTFVGGSGVALHREIFHFMGACEHALEPVKHLIGK